MNLEAHQPLEGFSNRPCRRCRRAAIRARSRPEQIYVTEMPRQKNADSFSTSFPLWSLHPAKSAMNVVIDRDRLSFTTQSARRSQSRGLSLKSQENRNVYCRKIPTAVVARPAQKSSRQKHSAMQSIPSEPPRHPAEYYASSVSQTTLFF